MMLMLMLRLYDEKHLDKIISSDSLANRSVNHLYKISSRCFGS